MRLKALLTERGVIEASKLIDERDDDELDATEGAIALYDESIKAGRLAAPGALVTHIRGGGAPGYKPPEKRTDVGGQLAISHDKLRRIRAACLAPEGFTREEAEELFAPLAKRAGTEPSTLIDSAVGPHWQGTPPHPCHLVEHTETRFHRQVRYGLVLKEGLWEPNLNALRPNSTGPAALRDYARAFWRWQDPPDLTEQAARLERDANVKRTPFVDPGALAAHSAVKDRERARSPRGPEPEVEEWE